MRIIRAQLEGVEAEPGRVLAADVARIITGLERAIARAAYLVLRKHRKRTGRHAQAIESASRLRFVGTDRGSFVELLALPDVSQPAYDELPIAVADLSSMAFDRLIDTITHDNSDADAELAEAVALMAADLGIGDRNKSITFADTGPVADRPPKRATIDRSVRERMQRLSAPMRPSKNGTLVGVLVEADFEEHTARLRLVTGTAVTVNFPPHLEDQIYEALRARARFEGDVRYEPKTYQAISVKLRSVERSVQLEFDNETFWQHLEFASLQTAQGTTGEVDTASLGLTDLTDDERAALIAALAE